MKLFKQLIVAPAALGLLAPISANASDVNFDAIASPIKDNMIIDPTDKSIPAVTITMKTPSANIDCQETCLKIFVTFLHDKKTSGCNKCKTAIIIKISNNIPYLSKNGMSLTNRDS